MEKRMTSNLRKILLFVSSILLTVCMFAGLSLAKPVTAETAENYEFSMINGASMRLNTPSGLGFTSKIDYTKYNELVDEYGESNVKTGTIIVRKSAYANLNSETFTYENLTTNNVKVAKIPNYGFKNSETASQDGYYEYRGSVTNVEEQNAEITYCARGYLEIVKSAEETTVIYTDFSMENNSKCIQEVSYLATKDLKDTQDESYVNLLSNGKYSKYAQEQFDDMARYNPTITVSNAMFTPSVTNITTSYKNPSLAYLTNSELANDGGVNAYDKTFANLDLDGYTGGAVKISNIENNSEFYVKSPQALKQETLNTYAKVGVYFAIAQCENPTHSNVVSFNAQKGFAVSSNVNVGSGVISFNKICYAEVDVSRLNNFWNDGKIKITGIWSVGTNTFYPEHNMYIGDIILKTQEQVDEEERIRQEQEEAIRKETSARILVDGITEQNYAQFKHVIRRNGATTINDFTTNTQATFIPASQNTLSGGYTGNAVEFGLESASAYYVEFPKGYLPEDTTNKYFSMWIAVKENDGVSLFSTADKNSYLTFTNNNEAVYGTYSFFKNFSYVSADGSKNEFMVTGAESSAYKLNTWYNILVPLSNAVTSLNVDYQGQDRLSLLSTYIKGFTKTNGSMLFGDVSIVDGSCHDNFILDVNSYSAGLEATFTGVRTVEFLNETQASAYKGTSQYSGCGLLVTSTSASGGQIKLQFAMTEAQKTALVSKGNTIRIWYANGNASYNSMGQYDVGALTVSLGGNYAINNTTASQWTAMDVPISNLQNATISNGYVTLLSVWFGTNASIVFGDIEVINVVSE